MEWCFSLPGRYHAPPIIGHDMAAENDLINPPETILGRRRQGRRNLAENRSEASPFGSLTPLSAPPSIRLVIARKAGQTRVTVRLCRDQAIWRKVLTRLCAAQMGFFVNLPRSIWPFAMEDWIPFSQGFQRSLGALADVKKIAFGEKWSLG